MLYIPLFTLMMCDMLQGGRTALILAVISNGYKYNLAVVRALLTDVRVGVNIMDKVSVLFVSSPLRVLIKFVARQNCAGLRERQGEK